VTAQRCWYGAQEGTCSPTLAPYCPILLGSMARKGCPWQMTGARQGAEDEQDGYSSLDHSCPPSSPLGWTELALLLAPWRVQFLPSQPSLFLLTFPRFAIQRNMVFAAYEGGGSWGRAMTEHPAQGHVPLLTCSTLRLADSYFVSCLP
jgi:hypothetical protein